MGYEKREPPAAKLSHELIMAVTGGCPPPADAGARGNPQVAMVGAFDVDRAELTYDCMDTEAGVGAADPREELSPVGHALRRLLGVRRTYDGSDSGSYLANSSCRSHSPRPGRS